MTRIEGFARGLLLSAFFLSLAACAGREIKPDVAAAPPPPDIRKMAAATPLPPDMLKTLSPVPDGTLRIHTLPVGAGNCQVVQCPNQNKLVVMDCGSKGRGTQGWTADDASRYIRAMIDVDTEIVATVSHPDGDHYNYLPVVFDGLRVNSLYIGTQLANYSETFRNWVANERLYYAMPVSSHARFYASPTPDPVLSCWRSDGFGGRTLDAPAQILAVNAGTTSNDASMVISMRYGNFSTMFTGDMTAATERAIHGAGPVAPLRSTVITGAHHGAESNGSNSPSWANATRPQFLMFSAGERFLHPRCSSVDNYLAYLPNNAPLHGYFCGVDGNYEYRATTYAVAVTDDNGLITVRGRSDGSFDSAWSTPGL